MEYFFLLAMSGVENYERDDYVSKIVKECKRLEKEDKWFPKIGNKEKTKTDGYGYGEQEKLIPSLISLTKIFPKLNFSFYHFYWDCHYLTIYNIHGEEVTIEEREMPSIHPTMQVSFSPYTVKIDNSITEYF